MELVRVTRGRVALTGEGWCGHKGRRGVTIGRRRVVWS